MHHASVLGQYMSHACTVLMHFTKLTGVFID